MKKVARFLQVNKQVEERVRTSVSPHFSCIWRTLAPFFLRLLYGNPGLKFGQNRCVRFPNSPPTFPTFFYDFPNPLEALDPPTKKGEIGQTLISRKKGFRKKRGKKLFSFLLFVYLGVPVLQCNLVFFFSANIHFPFLPGEFP